MKRKNNIFQHVPVMNVSRNLFDLSHEVKMSCKMGYLYPVLLMDALPGDTVRDQMTALVRFAPMLAPVMHRVDVTTHFFFVPNRLLTDAWESFITGGQDGTAAPVLPFITPAGIEAADPGSSQQFVRKGSLWDYLGLPTFDGDIPAAWSTEQINALPFRAYAKVWNDYYRDPNFDDELDLNEALEGNVSATMVSEGIMQIRSRGWEKDFFTSCLASPQRGPEVLMPLAGTGSVTYMPQSEIVGGEPSANLGTGPTNLLFSDYNGTPTAARLENIDEVTIDNSEVYINDLRRALAIQRWMENNARGGARYTEQIQAHFNVRVPDYRLQRAEYLGGGKQPVQISEVLSTAQTDDGDIGEMGGHGISVGKSNRFTYRCQEHGFVIGIMSVIPRSAYSQGIDKMWSRTTKFDYAWPELARLGEQEVLSKEIFFSFDNADNADNQETFGYIPRYSEYKFKNDRIAGDFRDTLRFWHLGRTFLARPTLSSDFTTMYEDPSTPEENYRRIFAVQDGTDYLWCQLFHRMTVKRPLPYFGVPSIL